MSNAFNPYREWLGLAADSSTPSHYHLFGLPAFASDPTAIAHAADEALAKVRAIRPGPQAAEWSKLLDELRAAKACLLNTVQKADYDAALRSAPTGAMAFTPQSAHAAPMAMPPGAQTPVPMATPPTIAATENTAARVEAIATPPSSAVPLSPFPSAALASPIPSPAVGMPGGPLPPPNNPAPNYSTPNNPAQYNPAQYAAPIYPVPGFAAPVPVVPNQDGYPPSNAAPYATPVYPTQPYYGQPGIPFPQSGMPTGIPVGYQHSPEQPPPQWGAPLPGYAQSLPPQPGMNPLGQPTWGPYAPAPPPQEVGYPFSAPQQYQPQAGANPTDMSWLSSPNEPMPWDQQPHDELRATAQAGQYGPPPQYGQPAPMGQPGHYQLPVPFAHPMPYGGPGVVMPVQAGLPMGYQYPPGPPANAFAPSQFGQVAQPGALSAPLPQLGVPLPTGAPDPMAPVNIGLSGMGSVPSSSPTPDPFSMPTAGDDSKNTVMPGFRSSALETRSTSNAGLYGVMGGVGLLAITVAVVFAMKNNNHQSKVKGPVIAHQDPHDPKAPDSTKVTATPNPAPSIPTAPEPKPPEQMPESPQPEPSPMPEPPRPEPPKPEPPKPEPPKPEPPKPEPPKPEPPKPEPPKPEPPKPEMPKPEMPKPDAKQIEQFNRQLGGIRTSLTKRDLPLADKQVKELVKLAVSNEQKQSAGRMELFYQYVNGFWQAVRESMKVMKPLEEILVGSSTRLVVAETGPNYIVVHVGGQNRRYTIDNLPSGFAFAIATQWFDKNPQNKLFIGAFYAIDEQGSLDKAKSLWDEAAKEGVSVTEIMPVLTNELKK